MDVPLERRVAAARWALALGAVLAALSARAETILPPAGVQPMTISFFVDRRLPLEMRPSLEEALRRLSDDRCAEVLADFADTSGRRLDANLEAIGQSPASYLGLVLFYDGRATEPCENRNVLAWTNPGSRAVRVCWDQFVAQQRLNVGYTANTIIHEALHTLGLGERPPTPAEITARVAERCGS